MELFSGAREQEVEKLNTNGVRLRVIGDRGQFPQKLRDRIVDVEHVTSNNQGLNLVIAANYGGRWDVTQATRQIAEDVAAGRLQPESVTEELISSRLSLPDLPEPDLFIRSGGERRISNYLLWQLAYTELYFTDCLWPDFDEIEFDKALESFATRQRRFGMTGDQVESTELSNTSAG
jgi:undecaprenyl diphosphate synthase